jgi:hypothetical protein
MEPFLRQAILIFLLSEPLWALEASPTPAPKIKRTPVPLSIFRKPTPDPNAIKPGSFDYSEIQPVTGLGLAKPPDFEQFILEACGGKKKEPSNEEKILGALGTVAGYGLAGVAAVQWLDAQGKKNGSEKGTGKTK